MSSLEMLFVGCVIGGFISFAAALGLGRPCRRQARADATSLGRG